MTTRRDKTRSRRGTQSAASGRAPPRPTASLPPRIRASAPAPRRGCLQVYTGDGKGKTTAAFGLALRAAGSGLRVFIAQLLKRGAFGELRALRRIPRITVRQFGTGRFVRGTPRPAERRAARRGLDAARRALRSGRYHVVILDEANCAVTCGLLPLDALLALAADRPDAVELVITGRDAHRRLVQQADLVSDIRARKHPFAAGCPARRGIEW